MTFAEIKASSPHVDQAKFDATTEEDIRQKQIEDGEDPDAPLPASVTVPSVLSVRTKLGMTLDEFASVINAPVKTVRDWEELKTRMDPAARSLLLILHHEPEPALRALHALRDTDQAADEQGRSRGKRRPVESTA